MSHRLKRRLTRAERHARQQITEFAPKIAGDEELLGLLEGATGHQRQLMLELLVPYLSFLPKPETLACPKCGLPNGFLLAHSCAEEGAAIAAL